ncbi:MAG: Fe-S cluster assembly protein SufD [Bacteroidales bacterium]|nr:Fe-S cluster assembly protein SufD [Bacteroidales bacterium]MDZ4205057.1 Fe-S cluster assembly protein SufD [Bacteroidales bacterium]
MTPILTENTFKEKMLKLFDDNLRSNFSSDNEYIRNIRKQAIGDFVKFGLPDTKTEGWQGTNLSKPLMLEYKQHFKPFEKDVDVEKIFMCEVHDLESYLFTQLNGWLVFKDESLSTLPGGIVVGSLASAFKAMPRVIENHYARYSKVSNNGFVALNTAFAQDGLFIYVPDGVVVDKPIQIINIINLTENLFIQPRNLVIMGKNSKLQLLHCDHSLLHKQSLINSVTEIILTENSELEYYNLQNKDSDSTLITHAWVEQHSFSRFLSNTLTLNAGIIRNNMNVNLNGQGCETNLYGLYLVDKEQHIDNNIMVDHQKPNNNSNQLFKGILDDQARAVFNGHILVRKDAQKTNAYQKNRNILLTDKATVDSNPQLEIYADDVRCSHGSTVGQLDPGAMFYMRSRGISEDVARMALMNAFASEIIHKINIAPLRNRIDEMVTKRLRGELSICDQCILDCNERRKYSFDIDLSRINC